MIFVGFTINACNCNHCTASEINTQNCCVSTKMHYKNISRTYYALKVSISLIASVSNSIRFVFVTNLPSLCY